jgi:hypothetical protein
VDRFESAIFGDPDATAAQYGADGDDFPPSFPDNGQWTTPAFAVSRAGVKPSANVTWYALVADEIDEGIDHAATSRSHSWAELERGVQ